MSHLVEVEKNFQVFVGIDFGTDGTGLAIALPNGEVYIHSKWKGYTRSQEVKPKTRILLDADGNFLAFGQPATNSYITMGGEKSQWLLFERFKMALYEKQKKSDDDDDENSDDNNENENVDINEKIRAVNGTEYEASKVFIEALKYIKSQVFKFLSKMKLQIKTVDDVQWILTVPAIWSEKAKFKMEQWSIEAGLINKQIPHHLKIVYEPDCASLSIQHEIKELKAKKKAAAVAKRKLEAKQKVDDDQVEDADVDKAKDNENDNENKNENANVSNVADEDESVKKENVDSDAEMQDNSAADKDENDKEKDDALDKDNGNNNDNDNEQSEQQAAYKEQNPDKDTEEAQEEEEEVVAAKQDEDNDEEKEEQDQDNDKDKQEGDGEDDNEVKAEVADQDKGDEIVQNEAEQPAVADADGDADADAEVENESSQEVKLEQPQQQQPQVDENESDKVKAEEEEEEQEEKKEEVHENKDDGDDDDDDEEQWTKGKKYILIDAGGGTCDVACHEIVGDGYVQELVHPTGGAWGSTFIDDHFLRLLDEIFSHEWMTQFKEEDPSAYAELVDNFRNAKQLFWKPKDCADMKELDFESMSDDDKISVFANKWHNVTLPLDFHAFVEERMSESNEELEDCDLETLVEQTEVLGRSGLIVWGEEFLQLNYAVWTTRLFDRVVTPILKHCQHLLADANSVMKDATDYICLVGGLGSSKYLQFRIDNRFGPSSPFAMHVIVPERPILSVVDGAARFGLKKDYIQARTLAKTYGNAIDPRLDVVDTSTLPPGYLEANQYRCDHTNATRVRNVFSVYAKKNQTIHIHDKPIIRKYKRFNVKQKKVRISVYASDEEDPKVVKNKPCAKTTVVFPPNSTDLSIVVELYFSDTKIRVWAYPESDPENKKEMELDYEYSWPKCIVT